MEEPFLKKPKLTNITIEDLKTDLTSIMDSNKNLIPIMNDELTKQIPLVTVVIGVIKNPKDISKTILALNQKVPIKNLQHLKRVSKKNIIIVEKESLTDSVEDFLKEKLEANVFESFIEKKVPAELPKVKEQYKYCNAIWPCNFHPNKYFEKLVSGNFFCEQELLRHKNYMKLVFQVAELYLEGKENKDLNICVVVDPEIDSVVAVASNDHRHPIKHAAMVAIDNVAKTQKGGAWETIENSNLLESVKSDIKFGAREYNNKSDSEDSSLGPYLCTGYYVYMLKEPCVMCSMALVHARAKRIFFCYSNLECGGVKSKCKLQTYASLNHHFEVFTGFL